MINKHSVSTTDITQTYSQIVSLAAIHLAATKLRNYCGIALIAPANQAAQLAALNFSHPNQLDIRIPVRAAQQALFGRSRDRWSSILDQST